VSVTDLLLFSAVAGGFFGLWFLIGAYAGVLFSRRAIGLLGASAGIALLGYRIPVALDVLLLVDAALLAGVWVDALLAPRLSSAGTEVSVTRDATLALSLGRAGEVNYRWRNGAPRRARLRVREVRPDVLGGTLAPRQVVIAAHGETREALPVVAVRRGHETAGGFAVDSGGPLGLGVRRSQLALPWEVRVYPALTALRRRAAVAQAVRRRELGRQPVRRLGEGRLFESLRDFVPGDDPRLIDWKATARRRKLITRQFEAERRQHVLLVLDAGRLLTADVAGVARMDYVVQAALELAYAAAQHDDNVGVMVFADGVKSFVAPQRGRRGLKQILDVLAEVVPTLVEPDYPGAFRYLAARNRKRALTVVFTDVIDRFASEALVANLATLRPRHLPLAVTLRNPELDGLASLRPETERDAWRKAAAEELLRSREEALSIMRRAGVLVLDVPPIRAAEAVVDKYLELKRRGRL
jgi:uncharacterized protein (DUF58 family)